MNDSLGARRGERHAVLVFPPVWVPMVPHLALPSLTAYLRQKGFRVTPLDANLDFFLNHLLRPETLNPFALRARRLLRDGDELQLPPAWRAILRKELADWEDAIAGVDDILSVFRDERRFFAPNEVLPAQDKVRGLLLLSSIAQWPGRISFNHYQRGDIWTEQDLMAFSDDPERNVFLPFWRDRVLPRLRAGPPLLVGISISSVHQFISALTLARLVRTSLPGVHVVIGGKHLLRIQDKLLEHAFYFREFFDSVVLNQGERPLERLLEALANGDDLGRIPNLIFLQDGRPMKTPSADPPELDALPHPDFSDLPWHLYLVPKRYVPIRMSEGCYWGKCTFCARYGQQRTVYASPERVVEQLEYLRDVHQVTDVSVNDDCLPPEYWDDLCDLILRRALKMSMLVWAKPVAGFTGQRLLKMARAGIRQIRWGVESAHPRVLQRMRKGTTVATARRVLEDAHRAGIWNHTCIILGFPTETREEAQTTLDFLRGHRDIIQSFILYSFVLYRDSTIYHHPESFGIRELRVRSTPFFDEISYSTDRGMSPREVQRLVRESKNALLDRVWGWPLWYYLKLREYLQLYLDRYGLKGTVSMPFRRHGLHRSWEGLGP